jgi:hypothetical protein
MRWCSGGRSGGVLVGLVAGEVGGVGEPVDGAGHGFAEAVGAGEFGGPACEIAGLLVAGEEAVDLAALGAEALLDRR